MTSQAQNLLPVQPSDLLQADATVIAGVLIFLTIAPIAKFEANNEIT